MCVEPQYSFQLSASIHGSSYILNIVLSAHSVRCEVFCREIDVNIKHREVSYFDSHSKFKAISLAFRF